MNLIFSKRLDAEALCTASQRQVLALHCTQIRRLPNSWMRQFRIIISFIPPFSGPPHTTLLACPDTSFSYTSRTYLLAPALHLVSCRGCYSHHIEDISSLKHHTKPTLTITPPTYHRPNICDTSFALAFALHHRDFASLSLATRRLREGIHALGCRPSSHAPLGWDTPEPRTWLFPAFVFFSCS